MMAQQGPTKVRNIEVPWRVLVVRADPAFEVEKRRDLFYKFSNGKEFVQNTAKHGVYLPRLPIDIAITASFRGSSGMVADLHEPKIPVTAALGGYGGLTADVTVGSVPSADGSMDFSDANQSGLLTLLEDI